MKGVSKETRRECFEQAGIKNPKRNPRYNIHHEIFKSDVKRGLVPKNFPLNDRHNLVPLPIEIHNELHEIIAREPAFRDNIDCRIWLANYAYNNELDMI